MKTRRQFGQKMFVCGVASAAMLMGTKKSYAVGEKILYLGVQPPSVGWGTTNTYGFRLIDSRNRPLANKLVKVWFSGQHSIKTGTWSKKTNANGDVVFTIATPRDWGRRTGWADINVSCNDGGVFVQKFFKAKK